MTAATLFRSFPRRAAVLGLLCLATALLATWIIDRRSRAGGAAAAASEAQDEAAIMAASLKSELDKFSLVPLVLAEDPQVGALLLGASSEADLLDRRLATLARQTNAAAIYLMNADGLTIAASNWDRPTSFVGSNYSFRPYFRNALARGSATQFALGTVSREPGLYIAQRVVSGGRPTGIVAVKVEFDDLEAGWRAASDGVFVTDAEGVVLLTSNDGWRFHATGPQRGAARNRSVDRRQFGVDIVPPLLPDPIGLKGGLVKSPLLDTEQPIALDGWVLHLLANPSSQIDAAVARGRYYLLLVATIAAGLLALAFVFRRRRSLQEEVAIAQRTRTLREQLNQANRLATLGQIAAGVGHEINQPVAAARLFAENGAALIATGRLDDAQTNFARIVDLADRIGRITAELRLFSRRDAPDPQEMPVAKPIEGALLLLHDRIAGMAVTLTLPDEETLTERVRAEPVRLEQVIINLLQNALDAAGEGGVIAIAVTTEARSCFVSVIDNGPGIAEDMRDRMFHPFATTKSDGLGLGLVISRDIMRDLGGDLVVGESPRGTRMTMKIPRA